MHFAAAKGDNWDNWYNWHSVLVQDERPFSLFPGSECERNTSSECERIYRKLQLSAINRDIGAASVCPFRWESKQGQASHLDSVV